MHRSIAFAALALLVVQPSMARAQSKGDAGMAMTLTSPGFSNQGDMPSDLTCEGKNISPALAWSGAPTGTKSFALIVDDPDAPDPKAPKMTWVHWLLYNLPPSSKSLAENVQKDALPKGALEGVSDFKRTGWGGPCPPIGKHRYFFKLYALDTRTLGLPAGVKAGDLERALQGHILAEARYTGRFERR